jgi:hypothetical protein
MVRQTAQFVIDQGQERLQVVAVATPPTLQELCDLTRRLVRQQIRPLRVGITGCEAYRFPFRLSNTEKHRKTPKTGRAARFPFSKAISLPMIKSANVFRRYI